MIVVSERLKQLYRDALHKMDLDAAAMELFEMKRSLQADLAQRAEEAAKEQKDVERLEGHSIKGLFLGLTTLRRLTGFMITIGLSLPAESENGWQALRS